MGFAAIVFLTLGIMIIGFGLLSLCNIFNLPLTDHQRDNANLVSDDFRRLNLKIMLLGAAVFCIGLIIAYLVGV